MYAKTTSNITVKVEPVYLAEQSSPADNVYVWAYHVMIENHGNMPVRLRNRYWHITDAQGRVQEVRGAGVVGEQPVIHPGEAFEYTSGTPLTTPSGIMMGQYEMQADDGGYFDVDIPAFSLDSPYQAVCLN